MKYVLALSMLALSAMARAESYGGQSYSRSDRRAASPPGLLPPKSVKSHEVPNPKAVSAFTESLPCGCSAICGCHWNTGENKTQRAYGYSFGDCKTKLAEACEKEPRCARFKDTMELKSKPEGYEANGGGAKCFPSATGGAVPQPSIPSIQPLTAVVAAPPLPNKTDFGVLCEILKGKSWAEIISGSTSFRPALKGQDSGVLNPTGTRFFYEKVIPDCGGGSYGITLRYTQDRVLDKAVYEVFVKSHLTSEVIGLAFNKDGQEIDIVPLNIATDKNRHYGENVSDRSIKNRKGCFRCHGNTEEAVSFVYNIPGAKDFWSDSKPVEFFKVEAETSSSR